MKNTILGRLQQPGGRILTEQPLPMPQGSTQHLKGLTDMSSSNYLKPLILPVSQGILAVMLAVSDCCFGTSYVDCCVLTFLLVKITS